MVLARLAAGVTPLGDARPDRGRAAIAAGEADRLRSRCTSSRVVKRGLLGLRDLEPAPVAAVKGRIGEAANMPDSRGLEAVAEAAVPAWEDEDGERTGERAGERTGEGDAAIDVLLPAAGYRALTLPRVLLPG